MLLGDAVGVQDAFLLGAGFKDMGSDMGSAVIGVRGRRMDGRRGGE